MRVDVKIQDIDMGMKKILSQLLQEIAVDIGYWENEKKHEISNVDLALIAVVNEFGNEHIPKRPFMRLAVEENRDKINNYIKKIAKDIAYLKYGWDTGIKKLAIYGMNLIKKKITESQAWAVENKPSTVKKKGSDLPLVDKGFLRRNIDYKKTRKRRKGKI